MYVHISILQLVYNAYVHVALFTGMQLDKKIFMIFLQFIIEE